jgi:hypothetical protein
LDFHWRMFAKPQVKEISKSLPLTEGFLCY